LETAVFILTFLIEVVFAAFCIVTRSEQKKGRSFIRIGALAAFALFTLASVIQWSFRWYGLALLLAVWALLGLWSLFKRQPGKKEYRAGGSILRAFGTLLLVLVAITPALLLPQHRLPRVTGQYEVATANYTYTDTNRPESFSNSGANRKLNVEFWYPKVGTGKYPLVVFSHGAFGVKASNTSTFMELASHGYVVCSIDHLYHALYSVGSDRKIVMVNQAFYQEVVDINNGKYDEGAAFQIEKKWLKLRTEDIHFVLNTILAQTQTAGAEPVYRMVDPAKIGLMGHSLGGESSAQVARERGDIGAVVNLDADLGGEYLDYANGKYTLNSQPYPTPILTILADDMVRLMADIPDAENVIALKHVEATAPLAYEVHLTGTDHQSLTDLPITSPFMVSMITSSVKKAGGGESADKYAVIERMNDLVLNFFNVYLKGEGTFAPEKTY
jgi:predicted dienelactone hydrolase